MKHWFRNQGRKKKVQFTTSGSSSAHVDYYPPRRAITPDLIPDHTSLDVSMSVSGQSTPRDRLTKLVRSRTPDGSLTSYYLDDESHTPSPKPSSLPRQPFQAAEPRFVSGNVDSNIRGRNHGYYIKAAGIGENGGNKENVKLIYDRSRMTSPNGSGLNSQYTSKVASNMNSRSGSFRNNRGQRRYLPKKRPAPRPPGGVNGGEHNLQRPYNSLDSRTSTGEVAKKVFRKKRKAPHPPPAVQSSWVDEQMSKSPFRSLVVDAEVYPIEPPIDYNKKVEESSEEEEVDIIYDEPMNDPPKVDDEVAVQSTTSEPVSVEMTEPVFVPLPPPAPPLPSADASMESKLVDSPPPPPVPQKEEEVPVDTSSSPTTLHPRMGTLLKKDILKAAMERANKEFTEPEIEYKSPHQIFAEELQGKVKLRDERMSKGALKVRAISSSRMYKAQPSPTPEEPPKSPLDDMIEKAQEQAKLREDLDTEKQKLRRSARVMTCEWLPEHDLDEVFNSEMRFPTSHLTARNGNYYDISNPGEQDLQTDSVSLYKKNQYARPSRKKSSNLEKLRRSIGKAFGSIGKGLHRKTAEIQEMYNKEDGWEIIYKEECDPPSTEVIKIKRMEKHAAYAYHAEQEQLVLLPDFDRIIVTQDGRRIRETELSKAGKQVQNKSLPSFNRKERPSLEGVFEISASQTLSQKDRTYDERQQISMMEDQFAQVRKINKKQTRNLQHTKQWTSTPDLAKGMDEEQLDAGVFSDTDLPLRTSSMNDKEKERTLDKLSISKRKKKSKLKKSSSSSESKSPRQKVLLKGMDYYIRSRPTTPNPVYSSDEEEDEGYDQVPSSSDPASSDSSSKQKSECLGDSGIGQESLNSSASTASGAPLAAQMQHLQQPMNLSQGQQMYLTSMPGQVFLAPVSGAPVMLANSLNTALPATGNTSPVMYQTMYYPSNSLPQGAHLPSSHYAGENKYYTLPMQDIAATFHNESGIPNSDSNSTLVPSANSTLEHRSTVNVTNGNKPESKSTSKVMNVTPNIAVVSYNNTGDRQEQDSKILQNEDNEFHRQLKKQYVMGPIGFRPVKFNPSVKVKPVSLPEKNPTDISDSSSAHVRQSFDADKVTATSPADIAKKDVEDVSKAQSLVTEHTDKNAEAPGETGEVKETKPTDGEINNNEQSSDPIPVDIRNKYADEELIYL